ncbi:LD-carboxypeptidase [Xanthomonas sp. MUS 060]|uniref:LD-carboxypeptidase n=1 Tax=Xanthomonas sp. MUS 060 TaxID=1588031 RepID=UPI0006966275|nr:LD-carboxypeptidase [Xanthomonas sp. MUS 060]
MAAHALDVDSTKEKVYLIASSSRYDERVIPKIKAFLYRLGYVADTRYLDQNPTLLGYVNNDEKRAATLIKALSDKNVKYLWFVRGGYGALNLYPALHENRALISKSTRKIIIGFSDVTAIHSFVNHELNWPSIHGVLAEYNKEMHELDSKKVINMNSSLIEAFQAFDKGVNYAGVEPLNSLALKSVSGKIDGGNLTLLRSFFSTIYESIYSEKIILLEDKGVSPEQLDRTLHQIQYNIKFRPNAVIFGEFHSLNAGENEASLYRHVMQGFAKRVNYPVYYYPKFGHGKDNQPFIMNQRADISCGEPSGLCNLTQPPVTHDRDL